MAAHFGRALLASLPAPAFRTGASAARPVIQVTCNIHLDGALRLSLVGYWVLSLSSVGRRSPLTMAEDAAGAAILFSAA